MQCIAWFTVLFFVVAIVRCFLLLLGFGKWRKMPASKAQHGGVSARRACSKS
jgi:hypothetical protein